MHIWGGYNGCIIGEDIGGNTYYTTPKSINNLDLTCKFVRVTWKDGEFVKEPIQSIAHETAGWNQDQWKINIFCKYNHRWQLHNVTVGSTCFSSKGCFIRNNIISYHTSSTSCGKYNRKSNCDPRAHDRHSLASASMKSNEFRVSLIISHF